ncbi:hypothetical protein HDR66_01820 [bacterium]|nr:hypothetical protein [bacterium]
MNIIQRYRLRRKIKKGAILWKNGEEKEEYRRSGNMFITTLKYNVRLDGKKYDIESLAYLKKGYDDYRTYVYFEDSPVDVFMCRRRAKKLFLSALYAMKIKNNNVRM